MSDWMARHEAQARELVKRLGISLEAASLIVELHDVADAFRLAAAAFKPKAYEMTEEKSPDFSESRTIFRPVDDA